MNLSMKQKPTHRHREETCGCPDEKEEIGTLELVRANGCATVVKHREE